MRRAGPDPALWLASVLRRPRSISHEGRVAALLAALRPVRADVYLHSISGPLHLSASETHAALDRLESEGFIKCWAKIRVEALELTLAESPLSPIILPVVEPERPVKLIRSKRGPARR